MMKKMVVQNFFQSQFRTFLIFRVPYQLYQKIQHIIEKVNPIIPKIKIGPVNSLSKQATTKMDKRSAMTIFLNNPTRMHKTPLLKLSKRKGCPSFNCGNT